MLSSHRARWCALLATLGLLALAHHSHGQSAVELPAAAELLDRHVEVTGGRKAHLALQQRKLTGTLTIDLAGHHIEAQVIRYEQAPGRRHLLVDSDHLSQLRATDGKHAWEWFPGHGHPEDEGREDTHLLTGERLQQELIAGRFHGDVHWRKVWRDAKTVGAEEIDGRLAYQVRLVGPQGVTELRSYDAESGRLVRSMATQQSNSMGQVKLTSSYLEYRKFDGVWLPTRVDQAMEAERFGKGTQLWVYEKVEHEVEVPAELFEVPEELHAQLAELKKHPTKASTDAADEGR